MESTNFTGRQDSLIALSGTEEAIFIIPSATLQTKSHDTEFPFRQNSDFKYLTGFNEPDCVLLLKKSAQGDVKRILFMQEKDPFMEMWTGIRLGTERALDVLSVDEAYPIAAFEDELANFIKGQGQIYFDFSNKELNDSVFKASNKVFGMRKLKESKPNQWKNINPLLGRLRLQKDANEIMAMKQAAVLSDVGHRAAMALCKPGVNEKEIDTLLSYLFSQDNGEGPAYDSIVAGGKNALILHYINNDQPLKDGDLLLIDAGAQVNTYSSDVTRTFPVNGKFTEAQKELYQLVLNAQKAAIAHMKLGVSLSEIHEHTSLSLITGLIEAGIFSGTAKEVYDKGDHRKYYPHGTGHWLGLDVHDQCPYLTDEHQDILLEEGMVFTCEPGLYFPENDKDVPERWRGLGIRIEDDLLMTKSGVENLTSSIPKEIKEIEEACQASMESIINKLKTRPLIS